MDSFFIGTYWAKRQESRAVCAARLSTLLHKLQRRHPLLADWYPKARTHRSALMEPLDFSPDSLEQYLETNNRDIDNTPILELGFSLGIWNGNDETPISLEATCGAFSDHVGNSVVLRFPAIKDDQDLADRNLIDSLANDMINTFDPDEAIIAGRQVIL